MPHSRAGSAGSIPGQGTKILPHSTACGQKTKNKHAEIIFHGTDDLDSTTTKKIDLNRKNRQRNQFS